MRAVLDAIPARIALLDRERRHCYVNQEYAAFVGKPPEEILGRTVAQVIGAAAYALVRRNGARALAGETVRWEGWLPYRAGGSEEARFVQRVYVPYRPVAGAPEGYFVFARDLTELKRGERRLAEQLAALRESEALGAAVTAAALDCVVVIDETGAVVEFNPAAEATFGHARADALGRPITELIVPPAMRARHADGFRRYLDTGRGTMLGHRVEVEGMRADGSVFPVELAIAEVRLPERRLFTAYLRDLTPVKRAATEIERQRRALQEAEKIAALGSLLAGVAHELNNPLSIVIGNALMLEEEAMESAASGLALRTARVREAAERCARVVRDFLAAARPGKSRGRSLAPAELVGPVLDLLQDGLREHDVEAVCDVPSGLPPVLGDPGQLHRVLVNLMVNARQALEGQEAPRRVVVAARAVGGCIEISVSDNGAGVVEAIRGRIFDPFFTTKPTGAGTGLGLAVSRGIVEAHGGSLLFAPVAEGGARFTLRLPVASGVAEASEAPPAHAPAPAGHG